MEKKRSKGVTFWSWWFIIFAIIGILRAINPNFKVYGTGVLLFYIIMCLVYLLCGIFVLKLNETARKTAILLSIISIILFPVYIKPALNKNTLEDYYSKSKLRFTEQLKPESKQEALEHLNNPEEAKKAKQGIFVLFLMIFGIPWLAVKLLPIYFFTRPKVKEQFK